MKFLKYCLAVILFALAFSNAQAQTRNLALSFVSPPPATIDTMQDPVIYIWIHNVDTGTYAGTFTYAHTINGVLGIPDNNSGLEYYTDTLSIAPGDSIMDSIIVHPSPPAFSSGPSVVVIWPIRVNGDFIAVTDSAIFETTITPGGVGINEPELGRMYYSNGRLFYQNVGETQLKHVRIADPRGIVVFDSATTYEQYIDLPQLSMGMYIVEAILSNNRRLTFKFIAPLH